MTSAVDRMMADALANAEATKAPNMIGVRMRDATRGHADERSPEMAF
ncbi:hypothetical protein [Bradyrhizobium sp. SZCCHNR1093]|nr:hypothetical protein [Bradyrhizobium sp. SZCCHNR1093]